MHPAGFLSVFFLAMLELWAAVPAGFALGLPALAVGLLSAGGSIVGVVVLAFAGGRLRAWLLAKRGNPAANREGRLYRVWERWGVPGLGLVGPLLLGAPLAALAGIALGAPRGRLVLWCSLGAALWTALFTAALALGVAL